MDQLLGEQNPSRLRHRDWRGADRLAEQPPQLPSADAEPIRQTFDVVVIEAASFNQAERPRHRAAPERKLAISAGSADMDESRPCTAAASA